MTRKKEFSYSDFLALPFPTEDDVMMGWGEDCGGPEVSILCNTYNQQQYIVDAIKGFLLQRTSFPFEIILHDDASTDSTAEIICKYSELYPKIIKPIIQEENQYSKGRKPTLLSFSHARGRYIALCEGDDFWIVASKLESQLEALKRCPQKKMCFHSSINMDANSNKNIKINSFLNNENYSVENVIKNHMCITTASLLFDRSVISEIPDFFNDTPVGDFYLKILGAYKGDGAISLSDCFSVYRVMSAGSWSTRLIECADSFLDKQSRSINSLDLFMGKKYSRVLNRDYSSTLYGIAVVLSRYGMNDEARIYIKKSFSLFRFSSFKQTVYFFASYNSILFNLLSRLVLYIKGWDYLGNNE